MITKVELKNWRSHLDSRLEFSPGTNILLGSIGSGKTSVLDAICFALFGTFPTLQTKKIKLDDVIMRKPVEKMKAEVELHFQMNGKNYSVRRVIERGKGTTYSEVKEDGKLIEAPNSQRVTERIEEILKVDYELFSKAIYSEQNALDYFLTIPKGQRMKKIDELLGIDKFEKARGSAVTLKNRIIDRKLGIEGALMRVNEEELKKNIFELEDVISRLLHEKSELKERLSEAEKEKIKIEEEVEKLKKVKEKIEILKMEEKSKESVLEEVLKSLKLIEEVTTGFSKDKVKRAIEEAEYELKMKEEELKLKRESYEKNFSEVSRIESKMKFLSEEKIPKLKKVVEEKAYIKKDLDRLINLIGENVETQIEENREKLEKTNSEISVLNNLLNDLNLFIQHLSSEESKCPVCESTLTPERKNVLLERKKEQMRGLQEKLKDLMNGKQNLIEELKKLEENAKKMKEMQLQIKDLEEREKELEDSENELNETKEFLNKARGELAKIKSELEDVEKSVKEGEKKKREYELLLIQLEELEKNRKKSEELSKEIER
ncbi:MAG: SMC family ATPase, partial [Candidatus Aenigmatarchaeota archaeon]